MTQKQKRLNRLSDMRSIMQKISNEEMEQLQNSRLVLSKRSHDPVPQPEVEYRTTHAEEKLLDPTDTETLGSHEFWDKRDGAVVKVTTPQVAIVPEASLSRSVEEAPVLPNRGEGRAAPSAGLRRAGVIAELVLFIAFCLTGLSAVLVLQNLERSHTASQAVLGAATVGYERLQGGGAALLQADFQNAQSRLEQAYDAFERALRDLQDVGGLASFLPQAGQAEKILGAGQEAVLALQYLTTGLRGVIPAGTATAFVPPPLDSGFDVRTRLHYLRTALQYAVTFKKAVDEVDVSGVPPPQRERLRAAQASLAEAYPTLQTLYEVDELLLGLFGESHKEYLLLFQNNRELRPTGGFIGTYGLLTLESGEMRDLKIESVYNPDGQLKEVIAPPAPLQRLISKEWGLRDSNWFFDFPWSARKAAEFFYKETGRTVDGVIAFTPDLFQRLLEITGPIAMPGYGVTLTAENFVDEVQYQTSIIYDRKLNQPKKFLADFAPVLMERLRQQDSAGWMRTFDGLLQSFVQKDVLLFSFDQQQQAKHESLNVAGAVRENPSDYLAVVHANVGAGKTDQDISQDIDLHTALGPAGMARHRLTIRRTYTPGKEKDFPTNVDYLRVYVPAGSRLIRASGFDPTPFLPAAIAGAALDPDLVSLEGQVRVDTLSQTLTFQESGKTVFANWVVLTPGTTQEVVLEYDTPLSFSARGGLYSYSLLFQKQPGAPPAELQATLELPEGRQVVWKHPQSAVSNGRPEEFSARADTDLIWGVVIQ